jgi:glutamine synthetase
LGIDIPSNVRFVHLSFTDLLGGSKVVALPTERVANLDRGVVFDGSATEGFARTFEEDKRLVPDGTTAVVLSSEPEVLRLVCDVVELDGSPSRSDPRAVLRQMIEDAASSGQVLSAGCELEFFLFRGDYRGELSPADSRSYFDETAHEALAVVEESVVVLESAGVGVGSLHHEVAPGQFEIDLEGRAALAAADAIVLAKHVLRKAAADHGLLASFMPKPLEDAAGSGLHLHLDLSTNGAPTLVAPRAPGTLTDHGMSFVAGQLTHSPALSALAAPLVNSYRRLASGFEAPVHAVWAHVNRAALVRVTRAEDAYGPIEFRLPDPAANPYLLLTGVLAAGLDGIESGLELPGPVEEDLYEFEPAGLDSARIAPLPTTLSSALDALVLDGVIADALGPELLDRYVAARRIEADAFARHVSRWEIERYLSGA